MAAPGLWRLWWLWLQSITTRRRRRMSGWSWRQMPPTSKLAAAAAATEQPRRRRMTRTTGPTAVQRRHPTRPGRTAAGRLRLYVAYRRSLTSAVAVTVAAAVALAAAATAADTCLGLRRSAVARGGEILLSGQICLPGARADGCCYFVLMIKKCPCHVLRWSAFKSTAAGVVCAFIYAMAMPVADAASF